MSFPRYPAYKDSGVEWLSCVPEHWRVERLKHVATAFPSNVDKKSYDDEAPVRLCNYTDVYYNDEIREDMDLMMATATAEQIEKFSLRAGDTIITKDSETSDDIAISAYVPNDLPGVVCGYHLSMVRPKSGGNGRFLKRFFDSQVAKAQAAVTANGLTRVGLGQYAIDNLHIAVPPLEEQVGIGAFLDRETAKIDALVAEQEQLITLLKEKRQAVISHAVTKGLDPSVPMKDSGVEWLGEVPVHWQVRRVKDVTRLESGHTPSKTVPEYWVDCDIPWVSLNDSKYLAANDYITDTAVQINQLGIENSSARLLSAGSVVFTRDATIGLAAITTREMAVSQHLIAWCPTGLMDPLYLLRVFNAMKGHLDSYTFGATIKTIGMSDVKSLTTPVPPHDEQVAIATFLGKELQVLNQLVDEAFLSIELLRERRSALISAAVTGQIDVRGLAPAQEQAA